MASSALDKVNDITGNVFVNDNTSNQRSPIAPSDQRSSENIQKSISESFLNIHLKGNTDAVEKTETNGSMDFLPNLTPTF